MTGAVPSSARAELDPGEDRIIAHTTTARMAEGVAGLLSIPMRSDGSPAGPFPAVAVIGERSGPDGRASLYARRLLSLGIAVLDVDFDQSTDAGAAQGSAMMPTAERLGRVMEALRQAPELDQDRLAVIGLGEGARDVLFGVASDPPLKAAALLYPGCDESLTRIARDRAAVALRGRSVLLLHGDEDPVNEQADCERLAATIGGGPTRVTHQVLRGATYGWDMAITTGPHGGKTWMPEPSGAAGRVLAMPEPSTALIGLDRVLLFLLPVLLPGDAP